MVSMQPVGLFWWRLAAINVVSVPL